jgi:hypothetical protein
VLVNPYLVMVITMWTRRFAESSNARWALLVLGCVMLSGCSTELSPAEQEFYGRSARITAGQRIDDVKRQLGEPTRIVDAAQPCRDRGGSKEWVYESFETPAGRERLQGGSVIICVTGQGVVVANFDVYK